CLEYAIGTFDEFLCRPGLDAALNQLKVLTKAVGDRLALPGIKSIVCAGSFALTTLIRMDAPQVKMVIGNQCSLSGDNIQEPSLQSPSGVPSPWNATSIVEASDFTMDQHIKLFNDIQTTYSMNFDKEVVDDVYSRTDGYPGLEGLLASLCIEFASTEHHLDSNTWDDCFTGFIRFPSTSKLSAVTNIHKYLDQQGEFEMKAKNLLGRFLQMRTMQKSDIVEEDSLALTHLRALSIIKEGDNLLDFTSNIIFDLLSAFYYPFHNMEISIPMNLKFEKPADFLEKVLTLLLVTIYLL
ncbi:907_t:CDS:1, partial [Paraglomus occultum]